MYRFGGYTRTTTEEANSGNSIIFAIVTNNINTVKKIVTSSNYNEVLDEETGFTALQYAIASPNVNNEIIKYLLNLGANPKQKIKNQNIDSFDLAIRYNKKYLFEYFNKIQDDKIDTLTDKIDTLNGKILSLEETNKYLTDSVNNYNNKIKERDQQITSLKKKNEESEAAFNNLLKKVKR